ncbi:hypothetical protein ASV01_15910 [Enterobacter kobei]|nr:hypothetical protein ASV01_15910 [Enterobacter kobei]
MSKVIASLEKVLLPFAVKIGKQPHVNAIKNGFIKLMPLTLAGAMFVLINNVFLSFGEGSFFYSLGIRLDASTIETLNGFKAIGGNVYNGTLGRVRISTLRNENETFSQLNSITYIGVFLRLVTYSHLPLQAINLIRKGRYYAKEIKSRNHWWRQQLYPGIT